MWFSCKELLRDPEEQTAGGGFIRDKKEKVKALNTHDAILNT